MSGYSRQYIEVDTRSITAMNGSVQGFAFHLFSLDEYSLTDRHRYEDTYRVIDAREAASLRSSRREDFRAERSPFYMREETVSTSRKTMRQQMSDFDALFAAAGNK
jgi:hypothetical protein